MRKRSADAPGEPGRYWDDRLRSPAFKQALTALLAQELRALATARVKNVVDPRLVRALIRDWHRPMIDPEFVMELVAHGSRRVGTRLRRGDRSLLGLFDARLVADVEAILDEDLKLSPHAEEFVAKLMRQEFVRQLFTDIIFTSIVSFNKRVNPLFGALTMRVMEEQIKGFIQLFMPVIQRQATSFAISQANQRIVLDFGRAVVRQLLNEPLRSYAGMVSSGQRRKAEALVRNALSNADLDAMTRRAMLAGWNDLYRTIRDKRIGDLVHIDRHADWLAQRAVEVLLPALARPRILKFLAAEAAQAAAATRRQRPPAFDGNAPRRLSSRTEKTSARRKKRD